MKKTKLFTWYRLAGLVITIAGVVTAFSPFALNHIGKWLIVIGIIVILADQAGKILSTEVMYLTPLYELLGITLGGFMMLVGLLIFTCGGLASLGHNDLSPVLLGLGLALGGAVIAFGSEGLKWHLIDKERKNK